MNPNLCPLCGNNNQCANLAASSPPNPTSSAEEPPHCWCMDEEIPRAALDDIPDALKGEACICQSCARRYQSRSSGVQTIDPRAQKSNTLRLGILNADDVREELSPEFGEYPDMFARLFQPAAKSSKLNLELTSWNVHRGEYPDDLDCVDAFLITGSKFSVYDDEPWIRSLGQFVQRLHSARKKLIGICFGHQLVAHQLGGRTEKSDRGWAIGCHLAKVYESFASAQKGQTFELLSSHQDQVVVPPAGARVVAGTEFCPISMMQMDDHILTIQSHPEFSLPYARKLYALREASFPAETYAKAQASLDTSPDQQKVAVWLLEFASAS